MGFYNGEFIQFLNLNRQPQRYQYETGSSARYKYQTGQVEIKSLCY